MLSGEKLWKNLEKNVDTYDVIMLFGSAIRFDSNFYQGFLNYWLTSTNVFVLHWGMKTCILIYVAVILRLVFWDSYFNHFILSILGNWGLFLRIVSCHANSKNKGSISKVERIIFFI